MTDRFWLSEFKGTTIVVDPLRTETAKRADLHLQPYPGTDIELVYGMLGVMQREQLIDRAFVGRHVRGWAAVEEQLELMTPPRAADITGVPIESIERAARLYGCGPSLIWMGIGLQRQLRGGDTVRAVAMLPAAAGHLGRAGAGFLYMNGYESVGVPIERMTMPGLSAQGPRSLSHMDLAATLESPRHSRVFFNWNTNVLASVADQAHEGSRRQDGPHEVDLDLGRDLFCVVRGETPAHVGAGRADDHVDRTEAPGDSLERAGRRDVDLEGAVLQRVAEAPCVARERRAPRPRA